MKQVLECSQVTALSPGEKGLFSSIIEHIYPEAKAGTSLPIERGEARAAKGLQRKGLIVINHNDSGSLFMTFTALGAASYERYRQFQLPN